jgi:hypothetical protein
MTTGTSGSSPQNQEADSPAAPAMMMPATRCARNTSIIRRSRSGSECEFANSTE